MKQLVHNIIYFLALGTIAVCMNVSVWACNLAWVVLLANWLVDWAVAPKERRRQVLRGFRESRLLQAFVGLFLLQVVGLLWSQNLAYGLDHVRKCFPLLALPMVLLTARPQEDRRMLRAVLLCYVLGIVAACIVGLVRLASIPDLPYRDIIPFVSHIRFSLNLCLAISLLLWQASRRGCPRWCRPVALLLAGCFLAFLFLLQSYTGVVILLALAVVAAIRSRKRSLIALMAALMLALTGAAAYLVVDYYHVEEPLRQKDDFVESGHYLFNDINWQELEAQWPRVSAMPLDSLTPNGYGVRPTLLRYLNASGFSKDSAGVAQLAPSDIEAIEKGIANPVYLKRMSLRRMAAVMLYEYENYRCYRSVKDFTMLQRFELWRNGWKVFLQHPLFGTGTGDVVDACHAQLEADQSPLAGTTKHTHCQYLTYLITFGLLGFALIVLLFVRGLKGHTSNFLLLVSLIIFLISCLTEDTLETLAGDIFFALFICLLSTCSSSTPCPTASE